jgi:hypothetical protein
MNTIPTPLQTLTAVARGYLPRVFQFRGWLLCGLTLLPVAMLLLIAAAIRAHGESIPPAMGLSVYHIALGTFGLPILALMAAPAGIREDLEQRTLPLMLVRPGAVWVLPFAKGLIWYLWCALWIAVAVFGLAGLGMDPMDLPAKALALVLAFWGELAFMTFMTLTFKRGALWGALVLFFWERTIIFLPGNLQRFTFTHYIQSITGTQAMDVNKGGLLAQAQITTPLWLSVLILIAFGLACWAACGWKLHRTPIGLAGAEAEG